MSSYDFIYAEQAINARLVVEKIKPNVSNFQRATNEIYKYFTGEPFTSVDVSQYSITNLPDTILRVPEDSVFKFILLMPPDAPDYRFVDVTKSKSQFSDITTLTVADKLELFNPSVPKTPIVTPTTRMFAPLEMPKRSSFATSNATTTDGRQMNYTTYNDPKFNSINVTSLLDIGELNFPETLLKITNELQSKPDSPIGTTNADVIRQKILDQYKFDPRLVGAVLSGSALPLNDQTVTIALTNFIVRQMGDPLRRKIDDQAAIDIAEQILGAVTNYNGSG